MSTAEEHLFPRDTLSRVTPPYLSAPRYSSVPIFVPFCAARCGIFRLENDESLSLRFGRDRLKKRGTRAVCFDRGREEEWRKKIDDIYLFWNFSKFFRINGKEKIVESRYPFVSLSDPGIKYFLFLRCT